MLTLLDNTEFPEAPALARLKEQPILPLFIKIAPPSFYLKAIEQNPSSFEFFAQRDRKVEELAVYHRGANIAYIEIQTDALCKLALRRKPFPIRHIRNQTRELCDIALSKFPGRGLFIFDYDNDQYLKDPSLIDHYEYFHPFVPAFHLMMTEKERLNCLQNIEAEEAKENLIEKQQEFRQNQNLLSPYAERFLHCPEEKEHIKEAILRDYKKPNFSEIFEDLMRNLDSPEQDAPKETNYAISNGQGEYGFLLESGLPNNLETFFKNHRKEIHDLFSSCPA